MPPECEKRHARAAVTTGTGMERKRGAAMICLVMSPCITETDGGDRSRKATLERCEGPMKVCCIKLNHDAVINIDEFGAKVDVRES